MASVARVPPGASHGVLLPLLLLLQLLLLKVELLLLLRLQAHLHGLESLHRAQHL